jgi:hypothetical protein
VESTSRPDGRSLTMVLAPNGGRKWKIKPTRVHPKGYALVARENLWDAELILLITN